MHWLFPSVVATLSSTLVFTFVYSYLYTSEKEQAFGIWSISWLIYSLRFICLLIGLKFGQSAWLVLGTQLFSLISVFFLIWGTFAWLDKAFSKYWIVVFFLLAIWIIFAVVKKVDFIFLAIPTFFFLGGIYIWVGTVFIRKIQTKTLVKYVAGWAFILWGIHKIDYPFLRPVVWFAPWGYLLASIFTVVSALAVVLLYFEKAKMDLSNSEERYRQLAESINEVFWIVSPDWKAIHYISPAYETVWGKPCESLYASPESWVESIIDEDKPKVINYIQKAVSENYSDITFPEYRIQRPDGSQRWIFARGFPIKGNNGEIIRITGLAEDITSRKQAEEALRDSEARWRSLTETSPDHILTLDSECKIEFANFASPGLTVEQLIGTPLYEYVEGDEKQKEIRATLESVLKDGNQQTYETSFTTPDNNIIYYESTVAPRKKEKSDENIGLTVSSRDITKRKEVEQLVKERTEFLDKLIDSSALSTWISDDKGTVIRANPACLKFFGAEEHEVIGKYNLFQDIVIQKKGFVPAIKRVFDEGVTANILIDYDFAEVDHVEVKKATHKYINSIFTPIFDSEGKVTNVIVQTIDLTEIKKAERQITASLKEKETLLHEIHHRVKNNMQVINSLLKLQLNTIEEEHVKDILRDSQSRVYAMSAVHETIHGSEYLSEIDLRTYLPKITKSILQSFSDDQKKVKLIVSIEETLISLNQAYPLGLIINELISNSMKYAFSNNQNGEILVNIQRHDNKLEMVVSDDGIGMPEGLDWKNSDTLGLNLVQNLVENQLDGQIDLDTSMGTKFTIAFSLETN